jgi:uncharacterized lipoprotein YmbA
MALALSLGACLGSSPPLERYRLTPAPAPASSPAFTGPAAPVIAVEPYATIGIYADPQIVYRLGEGTYGTYPNREWALPLGTMLADATVETMRAMLGLGARITGEHAAGSPELVWRGTVQQFEEVNRGDTVAAAVRLDATLVRTPGDSIVWQGTAALERAVPEPTMPEVVGALSTLATTAIRQLTAQAGAALQNSRRLSWH